MPTTTTRRTPLLLVVLVMLVSSCAETMARGESGPRSGSGPVIAAVGDLVCAFGTRTPPHHKPGTADRCQPEKAARIVRHRDFRAFLPLGDLQYSYGSAWRFFKYWDRYYGDVKLITR